MSNISSQLNNADLEVMLEQLLRSFHSQTEYIQNHAGNTLHTTKADGSSVTDIDKKVEIEVIEQFKASFPNIDIFGEESGYPEMLPEVCWLIDPIDGTKAFVKALPTYTCMAVCIIGGTIRAACIVNPSLNEEFTAIKGLGAKKNGQLLDLKRSHLPKSAYCKSVHVDTINKMVAEKGLECEPAPDGGGYAFSKVAEGTIAARFQLKSRGGIHDYAPGILIVEEAGGVIVPVIGDAYDYKTNCFVACHPGLRDLLQEHKSELRKLEYSVS